MFEKSKDRKAAQDFFLLVGQSKDKKLKDIYLKTFLNTYTSIYSRVTMPRPVYGLQERLKWILEALNDANTVLSAAYRYRVKMDLKSEAWSLGDALGYFFACIEGILLFPSGDFKDLTQFYRGMQTTCSKFSNDIERFKYGAGKKIIRDRIAKLSKKIGVDPKKREVLAQIAAMF